MKKFFLLLGVVLLLTSCAVRSIKTPSVIGVSANYGRSEHISFDFDFSRVESLKEAPDWSSEAAEEQYFSNTMPDWVVHDYKQLAIGYGIGELRYYLGNELVIKIFSDDIENNNVFNLFRKDSNLYYANLKPKLRELSWAEYNKDGKIGSGCSNVDIIALSGDVTLVGRTENFSIVQLNGETNKLHCVRFSNFLEDLTFSIPNKELDELTSELLDAPHNCFGYVHDNSLIFPVVFNTSNGIWFELCEIATEPTEISRGKISAVTKDGISHVFYGDTAYFIDNAERYIAVDVIDANYHYNTIYVAVVNDNHIDLKKTTIK